MRPDIRQDCPRVGCILQLHVQYKCERFVLIAMPALPDRGPEPESSGVMNSGVNR